ncbi:MAG: energy-coupled thiamine transporter ThiT [Eubacteriales bacterium]|nr:energy-coupled thiamine transporter ThiT [Eubacteriales bacterium]
MSKERIRVLVEIALMAALAMLLDVIIPSFGHGLKITIKMLPIVILALRRGLIPGLVGGFLWGLLQVVTGEAWILNALQVFLEYFLAFTLIGLAGLFMPLIQKELRQQNPSRGKLALEAGSALVLGSLARYIMHFFAGIAFWSDNLPEGVNAAINSLVINGSAFLSETLTSLVVLLLAIPFYRQLIRNDQI